MPRYHDGNKIDRDVVESLFVYDKGLLLWRNDRGPRKVKGKVAGSINSGGYYQVRVEGRLTLVHRIVWVMFNGPLPSGATVDHIDRNRLNNSIENLRLVSMYGQSKNKSIGSNNTSGCKGVSFDKKSGLWRAFVGGVGDRFHLGFYHNWFDAVCARKSAESQLGYSNG